MGLLDSFMNGANPATGGFTTDPLANIAMGLLANSGPSYHPVNPWAGAAQGLFRAEAAQKDWQQYQQEKQVRDAQLADIAAKQKLAQQLQARATAPYVSAAGPLPTDRAGMSQLYLGSGVPELQMKGLEMAIPAKPVYQNVKPGESVLMQDPTTGQMKEIYKAEPKADIPNDVATFKMLYPQVDIGSPEGAKAFNAWTESRKTPPVSVNTYGSPVAATDKDGNPVFIQPSKDGGAPYVIPGYGPPKKPSMTPQEVNTAKEKIMKAQMLKQQVQAALAQFDSASKARLATGMIGGHNPFSKQGQLFDAKVNSLRPTVGAITRVPGLGSMSDYETRLDQAKIPDRGRYDEVTLQQLNDLESLADGVISGYGAMIGGVPAPQAAPQAQGPEWQTLPSGVKIRRVQ